jgi:hypothetical protein
MRNFLKRLVKRTYVRILLIGRNSFTKESDKLTENDKICKAICYKLIKHSSSKFLIAPRSGKRYIKNDVLNIFLILDDRKITITNHVYHYDVTLPERDFERISRMYDDKTELIRETYESDMMSQIVYSLSTILKNVSEKEKLDSE